MRRGVPADGAFNWNPSEPLIFLEVLPRISRIIRVRNSAFCILHSAFSYPCHLPIPSGWFKFLAAGHDRGAGQPVFDDLRGLSGAEWKHGPGRSRLDGVSPCRRGMGAGWTGEGGRGAQGTERPPGWEEWKRLPATHWPSPPSAFAWPSSFIGLSSSTGLTEDRTEDRGEGEVGGISAARR